MTTANVNLAAVLEHLAGKATAGPWKNGDPSFHCTMKHQHGVGACVYAFRGWHEGEYWSRYIYRDKPMEKSGDEEMVAGTIDYDSGGIAKPADAELICTLVNNLPQILAALRRDATGDRNG